MQSYYPLCIGHCQFGKGAGEGSTFINLLVYMGVLVMVTALTTSMLLRLGASALG